MLHNIMRIMWMMLLVQYLMKPKLPFFEWENQTSSHFVHYSPVYVGITGNTLRGGNTLIRTEHDKFFFFKVKKKQIFSIGLDIWYKQ